MVVMDNGFQGHVCKPTHMFFASTVICAIHYLSCGYHRDASGCTLENDNA